MAARKQGAAETVVPKPSLGVARLLRLSKQKHEHQAVSRFKYSASFVICAVACERLSLVPR
jgi:hypothetical protein